MSELTSAKKRIDARDSVTPMMAQYLSIKEEQDDSLLFYRMGDFYELFFDDAVKAAAALDITLTKRGKHLGQDIPMCGVPVHSHETYLNRLIRKGYRVAVCEQVEDPEDAKKRGSKAVVKREVLRLVTPGTLTEDTLLNARRHNYLVALACVHDEFGLAWADVSTGTFFIQFLTIGEVDAALARLDPGEILVAEPLLKVEELYNILVSLSDRITSLPLQRFDSTNGQRRLEQLFGVATLDSFGSFSRAEVAAAGSLVDYIELTQKGKLPHLNRPERVATGSIMGIDNATRRNLELSQTLSGTQQGSLLSIMDETITGPGARMLATRLSQPLTDFKVIGERLTSVDFLLAAERLRENLRTVLKKCPDMMRSLSRLSLGRGGPRDLAAIRDGLVCAQDVKAMFKDALMEGLVGQKPDGLQAVIHNFGNYGKLVDQLFAALSDELPLNTRDGGFISSMYDTELDEQVALRDKSRKLIVELQAKYGADTGLTALKIKYNKVLGYFIEVPTRQAERIPQNIDKKSQIIYIHRQTLANAVRYTTIELSELESRIAKAADTALALELELFETLVAAVLKNDKAIALAANALAEIDVYAGLATLAERRRYVRPIVDDSSTFHVVRGRHPVVEGALEANGGAFVSNDCRLGNVMAIEDEPGITPSERVWLLTGPNMAGKSTFLRQNALIIVMAQMGSFVPAQTAHIGIVDNLFSRVGAADDLARGRSTFMVEMVETASILNQAGSRAFVILDEIGRGTATYDGLSIAWAVVEYLHNKNKCRALFATHYHELTALTTSLDKLRCYTMRVKDWKDDVVFLHEVKVGAADRSYGIHVGKLAGLPETVVIRANEVLQTLETDQVSSNLQDLTEDLPLFKGAVEIEKTGSAVRSLQDDLIEKAIKEISPDEMSPREALEFVYLLKNLSNGDM